MLVFCLAAQDGGDHDSLVAGEEEPGQMASGNKVAGGKQGGRWQTRWQVANKVAPGQVANQEHGDGADQDR